MSQHCFPFPRRHWERGPSERGHLCAYKWAPLHSTPIFFIQTVKKSPFNRKYSGNSDWWFSFAECYWINVSKKNFTWFQAYFAAAASLLFTLISAVASRFGFLDKKSLNDLQCISWHFRNRQFVDVGMELVLKSYCSIRPTWTILVCGLI